MQQFYDVEYEGNITEHLHYSCDHCNDTGFIVDFMGSGSACNYCETYAYNHQQPWEEGPNE